MPRLSAHKQHACQRFRASHVPTVASMPTCPLNYLAEHAHICQADPVVRRLHAHAGRAGIHSLPGCARSSHNHASAPRHRAAPRGGRNCDAPCHPPAHRHSCACGHPCCRCAQCDGCCRPCCAAQRRQWSVQPASALIIADFVFLTHPPVWHGCCASPSTPCFL